MMNLAAPEQIALVLGLPGAVHSFAELDDLVTTGLPKAALRITVNHLYANTEERTALMYRLVPQATYKRRQATLSAQESERVARLARVIASAEQVWGAEQAAQTFMVTPHPMLQDMAPVEACLTEIGARRVEVLLERLFFGVAA